MGKSGLTNKQIKFVQEYLVDLDATKAAKRAGYSDKMAGRIGWQLLHDHEDVKAAIEQAIAERAERTRIKADDVLRELAKIALVDLGKAYSENGGLLDIQNIPEDIRRAIAHIEVFEEYEGFGKEREHVGDTRKVKFFDKVRALELLGKHLGMFVERVGDPDGKPLAGPVVILRVPANGSESKD